MIVLVSTIAKPKKIIFGQKPTLVENYTLFVTLATRR